jgi:hypothetical protein
MLVEDDNPAKLWKNDDSPMNLADIILRPEPFGSYKYSDYLEGYGEMPQINLISSVNLGSSHGSDYFGDSLECEASIDTEMKSLDRFIMPVKSPNKSMRRCDQEVIFN